MGKITGKSQKGQEVPHFTEEQAREYFENLRWNGSPACVHCGSVNVTRLKGAASRPGTIQCNDCREQFTVTVCTIMEDSHLPLSKWVKAFHYMCAGKKGISALQLQRQLGLGSYRTAWHLAHRIREAMKCEPVAGMLKGEVQVDETYVGASRRGKYRNPNEPPRKRGRGTEKSPVLALVETGGNVHSHPIDRVDTQTLKTAMEAVVDPTATIVTDELRAYPKAVAGFSGGHLTVRHGDGQFVGPNGHHTNTAESYFALLKRGIMGSFHHVSKKHLHRYCCEFDFRWNNRTVTDSERRDEAAKSEGKRLTYKALIGKIEGPSILN